MKKLGVKALVDNIFTVKTNELDLTRICTRVGGPIAGGKTYLNKTEAISALETLKFAVYATICKEIMQGNRELLLDMREDLPKGDLPGNAKSPVSDDVQ